MCGIALQAGYITRIVFFLHKTTTHRTSIWLGSQFDFFSTQFSEYFDSKFIFLLVFFDEFRTFRYHSFQLFARMNLFISIFFPGCYSCPKQNPTREIFLKVSSRFIHRIWILYGSVRFFFLTFRFDLYMKMRQSIAHAYIWSWNWKRNQLWAFESLSLDFDLKGPRHHFHPTFSSS